MLETLNRWYDEGHRICYFTARVEAHRTVTEKWLKDNGFKYHSLLMENLGRKLSGLIII